ncbi:MAG: hypothetical protein ACJ74O_02565 [Frankiaceae bacterium]
MTTTDRAHLAAVRNVPDDYRHYAKLVTPGDDLVLQAAHLKWYEVRRAEAEIDEGVREQARDFVRAENEAGRLDIDGELGFAVLHRCGAGETFYFLLVCTWRNANEMWESVYGMDTKEGGPFRLVPQGDHLEVMCVWELGAVLHEQQAWSRYLYSARDEQAKLDYLADRFSGTV